MRLVPLTLSALLLGSSLVWAEPNCGEPPLVADQSLKGEIDGKAQLLTRWVGDAALKGQVEAVRNDIFSKYPDARQAHSDTYLLYMFCSFVLPDPKLSAQDKLHAIMEVRQTLAADETRPGPHVSTTGEQSPAMVSGGDAQVTYGAPAPASPAGKPDGTRPGTAAPHGSATTEGGQSPAMVSGGNNSVTYGSSPPPPAPAPR